MRTCAACGRGVVYDTLGIWRSAQICGAYCHQRGGLLHDVVPDLTDPIAVENWLAMR